MDKTNATLDQITALLSLRNPSPPIPGLARELLEKSAATIRAQADELERRKAAPAAPVAVGKEPVAVGQELGEDWDGEVYIGSRMPKFTAPPAAEQPDTVKVSRMKLERMANDITERRDGPAPQHITSACGVEQTDGSVELAYSATSAVEQPYSVVVPRDLLEQAATWLEVHAPRGGCIEGAVADDLRALLAGGAA